MKPRLGERSRLTALYGGLLLLAGGGLIGLVYWLLRNTLQPQLSKTITTAAARADPATPFDQAFQPAQPLPVETTLIPGRDFAVAKMVTAVESTTMERLLTVSLVALGLFAVLSVLLAWWMAGRVLRPVHTITATARRLSGENLHERIALKAPPGELKDLADTFDSMLDRIQALVESQRRFTANAAHELRTPLAVQRAAVEIGLTDPDPQRVERTRVQMLGVVERSERLIEGLLLLAASDQGLGRREKVRLDRLVAEVAAETDTAGLSVEQALAPRTVDGDPVLLRHLVRNLIANAARYNTDGGRIGVFVNSTGLTVVNTGPVVPDDVVPQLFEPFRRMQPRRHAPGEGTGLGLSIVASIARAHGAETTATANPEGGLTVRVAFH